jgi:hypothetical protein
VTVPPGVGKAHLAVALGLRAIEQGFGVYVVRAQDLLEDLRRARAEHRLDCRMRAYLAPKLLIVDEFGVWSYDRLAVTALFSLISARYERGSIILEQGLRGMGRGLGRRGDCYGDPGSAAPSQPRAQHPRRELSPAREEAGRALRRQLGPARHDAGGRH